MLPEEVGAQPERWRACGDADSTADRTEEEKGLLVRIVKWDKDGKYRRAQRTAVSK